MTRLAHMRHMSDMRLEHMRLVHLTRLVYLMRLAHLTRLAHLARLAKLTVGKINEVDDADKQRAPVMGKIYLACMNELETTVIFTNLISIFWLQIYLQQGSLQLHKMVNLGGISSSNRVANARSNECRQARKTDLKCAEMQP